MSGLHLNRMECVCVCGGGGGDVEYKVAVGKQYRKAYVHFSLHKNM